MNNKRGSTMERGQTKTSRGVALLLALACAAQVLVLTVGTQAATAATGPTAWSLSWSDEFNTAASARPDSSRWGYDLGGGGFGNAERQYYTDRPENISSDGTGNLAITARKETLAGSSCWYGTCQYTSGRVLTKNKFTQRYGRFESRMKLPAGQGVWPAFWMQGDDSGSAGTAWPGRGELDIMENVGYEPSSVHGSLHGPGYSGGSAITKGYTLPGGAKFSDAFHTFSVEWAPNEVRWYVDDVLYETRTPADLPAGSPWVFDHPFYILMNFAVGGQWPGDPSATTAFPQSLLVDYVRVYTPTTTPTTTLPVTPVRSALSRIEAESFDAQSGVAKEATTDTGGGQNIGWIANGDSVTYCNVDFGSSGVSGVTARVASGAAAGVTGTAELHLDSSSGPIVGNLALSPTGGWQTWASKSATVTGAVGVHDLVVVFRSSQPADFTNLNWLSFTAPPPPTTTTTTVPTTTTTTTTTVPQTTTTTTTPPTTVPTAPTRDAYSRIESESSDASVGVIKETTTDIGGGQDIGWIANGDSAMYRRVNFGSSGATGVSTRV
ncbi:MAG: carbohydrate-binding protein, partial [Actinobacteria bacterium]|nr:carbohydrate-binding protein [Actinomycetota bacterium]